eukprot:GHVP01001636.1.p1 GENE.GHVP01001636.1~~GHVP01001636.1.p1  ORF type:complete len:623 (-),score=115.85 GHVP01001636.1:1133-3001(-)
MLATIGVTGAVWAIASRFRSLSLAARDMILQIGRIFGISSGTNYAKEDKGVLSLEQLEIFHIRQNIYDRNSSRIDDLSNKNQRSEVLRRFLLSFFLEIRFGNEQLRGSVKGSLGFWRVESLAKNTILRSGKIWTRNDFNDLDLRVFETSEFLTSYSGLENKKMEVFVYRIDPFGNEIISSHSESLSNLATSNMSHQIVLYKHSSTSYMESEFIETYTDAGDFPHMPKLATESTLNFPLFRFSAEIQFEELFDFGISFSNLRLLYSGNSTAEEHNNEEVEECLLSIEEGDSSDAESDVNEVPKALMPWKLQILGYIDESNPQRDSSLELNAKKPKWAFSEEENLILMGTFSSICLAKCFLRVVHRDRVVAKATLDLSFLNSQPSTVLIPLGNNDTWTLSGTVGVHSVPLYNQTGSLVDLGDPSFNYLILKILRIDLPHLPLSVEQEKDPSFGYFADVTVGDQTIQTSVLRSYKDMCWSSLELVYRMSEIKGSDWVTIDLWATNEHQNYFLCFLQQKISDIFNNPASKIHREERSFYSVTKCQEEFYSANIVNAKFRMSSPWDTPENLTVDLQIWSRPDIDDLSDNVIQPSEETIIENLVQNWEAKIAIQLLDGCALPWTLGVK